MSTDTTERRPTRVILHHRRGRETEHNREFADEADARRYCKEHGLMVVHHDLDGDVLRLHYLPE